MRHDDDGHWESPIPRAGKKLLTVIASGFILNASVRRDSSEAISRAQP